MNSLPVNRILFVGIEFPGAATRIPAKNVVHQMVVHAVQVGDIVPTAKPMPWVFDVPCQHIDPEDVDLTEEPIGNSDGCNSVSRCPQLLPLQFADVCCSENRFDFF